MIKVYVLDCSPLFDEQKIQRVLPCLNTVRREKVERLQTVEKKAQSAAAGLLLRHLFGDVEYVYGENGKPYLSEKNAPYFSVSHSDKFVVCAVSEKEIGVDIEKISPIRSAVLRRCFTEEEQEWIGDNPDRFTQLWTKKEAYIKMTGTGLSVPPIKISVPLTDSHSILLDTFWISVCSLNNDVSKMEYSEIALEDII